MRTMQFLLIRKKGIVVKPQRKCVMGWWLWLHPRFVTLTIGFFNTLHPEKKQKNGKNTFGVSLQWLIWLGNC